MYHNTTHSTGTEVRTYRKKAQTQEDLIWDFFKKHPYGYFTASDVMARLALKNVPLTSIRRGITNLVHPSKIEKTTHQKQGPFGRPEYCYRFVGGQLDMFS